jgi:hypothetical protein
MSTKKTTQKGPTAVAKLPKNPSQLATRADGIATAVDDDTANFPTKTPEATQTHTDVATLRAAIQTAETRGVGTVAARNVELTAVKHDVKLLVNLVQGVANKLPRDAAVQFIASKLLSVSQAGKRGPKAALTITQGPVPGSVKLSALSLGTPVSYFFEFSSNQKDWTAQPEVHVSRMSITGLTPGQTYYFRVRAIVKSVPTDYGPVVPFLVK